MARGSKLRKAMAGLAIVLALAVAGLWWCFRSTPVVRGPQAVGLIPPGAVIEADGVLGWSNVLLVGTPRLGSGDFDKITNIAAEHARMFKLVMLANVTGSGTPPSAPFRLEKVAVGFALPIEGRETIIDTATQGELGANLGFIARQVLDGNEKSMAGVQETSRSETTAIVDAKSIVLADGKHVDRMMRHLIWAEPATGHVDMAVWLLKENAAGGYEMASDDIQLLPNNYREDRIIDVDANRFTLGIPSPDAFALVRLPPGETVKVDESLAKLATKRSYSDVELQTLVDGVKSSQGK